ncbi:MAG: hypothetical protein WCF84_21010 [Anaerolineae bacterium]
MDLDLLAELERAQLIRRVASDEPAYSFKHALTQEAAYQSLLHKKRAEIHRRVAEAYERIYPDHLDDYAALLVRHYGEAGNDAKTIEYARRAGDAAARVHAHAEALGFYVRAIEVVRRAGEPAKGFLSDLFIRRGRILELSSQYTAARESYQEMETIARERGDRAMELAALMARTTVHSIPTPEYDFARAQELSAGSLHLARELGDRPAEAKILWNRMLMYSRNRMDVRTALAAGEESLTIARSLNLRAQLAFSLNDISILYLFGGQPERGEETLREARALWRELDNLPMLTDNFGYAAMGHLAQGKFEQAIAEAEQARQLSIQIGNLWGEAFSRMWIGPAFLEVGRPDRAVTAMQAAIDLAEQSGFIAPISMAASDLGALYGDFGAIERGLERVERALSKSPVEANITAAWVRGHMAHLLVLQGNLDRAESILKTGWYSVSLDDANLRLCVPLRLSEGELALAHQDYARALEVFDALAGALERLQLRQALPMALRGKGLALQGLGRREEALSALELARTVAESLHAKWSLWQILAVLVDLAVDPDQARALRRDALTIIDEIGSHTPDDLRESFFNLPAVKQFRDGQS